MQLCRCGHNLMNRMSPLYVGLITVYLILWRDIARAMSPFKDAREIKTDFFYSKGISDQNGHMYFNSQTLTTPVSVNVKNEPTSLDNPIQEIIRSESSQKGNGKKNGGLVRLLYSLQNFQNRSITNPSKSASAPQSYTERTISGELRHKKMGAHNISDFLKVRLNFHQDPETYLNNESDNYFDFNVSNNSLYNDTEENHHEDSIYLENEPEDQESQINFGKTSKTLKIQSLSELASQGLIIANLFNDSVFGKLNSSFESTATNSYFATDRSQKHNFVSESPICTSCIEISTDIIAEALLPHLQNASVQPETVTKINLNFSFNSSIDNFVESTNSVAKINETVENDRISEYSHSNINDHSPLDYSYEQNDTSSSSFNINSNLLWTNSRGNFSVNENQNPSNWNTPTASSEFVTRRGKMSDGVNSSNQPHNPKKQYMKEYSNPDYDPVSFRHANREYSIPEFQPGAIQHYLEPFRRLPVMEEKTQPILHAGVRYPPRSGFGVRTKYTTTAASTFFPFRLEDTSTQYSRKQSTVTETPETMFLTSTRHIDSDNHDEEKTEEANEEDDYYIDFHESSLTMETLAYFLIGTCCGLSILCLCIVVIALRCRRTLVRRRMKRQFRRKLCYANSGHKPLSSLWQHQFLNHISQQQDSKRNNSSFSSNNSCNCRCVTWSLGARNLDTQPICPNRSSVYLCGRKRLPFGAASTLQYESMLGRRRQTSPILRNEQPPKPESSNENDSLDGESGTEPSTSMCPKQCTCIRPPWMLHKTQSYSACSANRTPSVKNCVRGSSEIGMELRRFNRNCPPPVSGMNYLDRADGVVYWSSNEERLI